jgi:serine/threonine-protein kinase
LTPSSLLPSQWAVVSAEFPELAAASPAAREARLVALAAADAMVAAELRSLLAAVDTDDGVVDRLTQQALTEWQQTRSATMVGRAVGPWTITDEVGRGGMGIVYAGVRTDGEFAKRVAIKTLAMAVQRPELLWRFRRERQILATLNHPNITALFDGGTTDDGVPYLVMEYVDGVRLDLWCEQQQLPLRARLDLFRTVCAAVQFAHAQLVVHRDLKPANILVTRDGVVKLLDFGVAKLMADDTGETTDAESTRTGLAPLTTAYASPEQARGDAITTATDIYALGVLLFRLLTGAAPYDLDGKSAADAMRVIIDTAPRVPSAAAPAAGQAELRGELDAIVLMALRKDAARRYPTVQALSDDVLRYLKGEPVTARPERLSYTVRTFVRRNRGLSMALGLAALSLVTGTVVSTWQARRAKAEVVRATRVREMLESVVSAGDPFSYNGIRAGSGEVPLRVVLDSAVGRVATKLADDPETRAELYRSLASSYVNLDQLARAGALADSARTLHMRAARASTLNVVADGLVTAAVERGVGHADRAMALLDSLWALAAVDPEARDSLGSLLLLESAQVRQLSFQPPARVEPLALQALQLERTRRVPRWPLVALNEGVLAVAASQRGQGAVSDSLIAQSLSHLAVDSVRYPSTSLYVLAFAGFATYVRGAFPASEAHWRRALTSATRVFGAQHPLTAQAQSGLSWTLLSLGKVAEGKALSDASLATERARPQPDPMNLSGLYRQQLSYALVFGDSLTARTATEHAERALPATGSARPYVEAYLRFTTAAWAMQQRDTLAAWQALKQAERVMRRDRGGADPITQLATGRLMEFSARMGRDTATGERLRGR